MWSLLPPHPLIFMFVYTYVYSTHNTDSYSIWAVGEMSARARTLPNVHAYIPTTVFAHLFWSNCCSGSQAAGIIVVSLVLWSQFTDIRHWRRTQKRKNIRFLVWVIPYLKPAHRTTPHFSNVLCLSAQPNFSFLILFCFYIAAAAAAIHSSRRSRRSFSFIIQVQRVAMYTATRYFFFVILWSDRPTIGICMSPYTEPIYWTLLILTFLDLQSCSNRWTVQT